MTRDHMMGYPPVADPVARAETYADWAMDPSRPWQGNDFCLDDDDTCGFPLGVPTRVQKQWHQREADLRKTLCANDPTPRASKECAQRSDYPGIAKHNHQLDLRDGTVRPDGRFSGYEVLHVDEDAVLKQAELQQYSMPVRIDQMVSSDELRGTISIGALELLQQTSQEHVAELISHRCENLKRQMLAQLDKAPSRLQRALDACGQVLQRGSMYEQIQAELVATKERDYQRQLAMQMQAAAIGCFGQGVGIAQITGP